MKKRVEYYDVLRGLAITAVIAIHTTGNIESLFYSNKIAFHIAVIWRQIIGFAVPLFLAISGYFLSNKIVSDKYGYRDFLSNQVPRVYIPMIIWSLPLLILSIISNQTLIKPLLFLLVGGFSVYYFIPLVIQFYVLLPILQRIANKRGLLLTTLISFLSLSVLFYFDKVKGVYLPLVVYAGPFPMWVMFFVLGIYLGKNKTTISKSVLVVFTIIGLIISIAETYWLFDYTNSFNGLGIKIGSFIYSFGLIVILFSLEFKPKFNNKSEVFNKIKMLVWKFMAYYGRISFGIYLIHMYVLSFLTQPLLRVMGISSYFIEQVCLIIFTMMVCVIGINIVRKINKPLAIKYLGF